MKIKDFHDFHNWVFKCCQEAPRSSPGALQKPLGRTMGLQDKDKSSPRVNQESLGGLQERSKSSPEAAKSAPEGLKRLPRAVQIVDRSAQGCQDSSKTPQESSKRSPRGNLDPPKGLQDMIFEPS